MTMLLAQLAPQSQQTPTGSIEGIVAKMGSSDPIAGAEVELTRVDPAGVTPDPALRPGAPGTTPPTIFRATTSDDGRFLLKELPAGRYRLVATLAGGMFTPAEYGQRDPGGRGTTLLLSNGQKLSGIRLSMTSTGVITGRVYDGDDEPVPNARVLALEAVYRDGRRVLNTLQAVRTNDLGEYRLFWLRPGRYYIGVMREDVRNFSFVVHVTAPDQFGNREDGSSPIVRSRTLDDGRTIEETTVLVYYGGGTDEAKAQPVDLPPGTTVSAIDVSVRDGTMRAHRVKGTVIGSNGQPAGSALVRLVPAQSAPHVIIPNMTADRQGAFNLGGVVPGTYFLVAMLGIGQGYSFYETFLDITNGTSGIVPIQVSDRDIENVSIALRPSFSLNGRVYVEGVANDVRWDITKARISLTRDPALLGLPSTSPITGRQGPRPNGAPAEDGSFTLNGFGQGSYRVGVNVLPASAYVKAIQLGGLDVLRDGVRVDNAPQSSLDILINLEGGTLQGIAMNDRSEPVVNSTVVLVPDLPSRGSAHLYKVVSSDVTGAFEMKGIAPGSYKVFAWNSVPSGAWTDPEFIRSFENAGKPITFSDGSTQQIQVTVR
jgi:hypothetical protein